MSKKLIIFIVAIAAIIAITVALRHSRQNGRQDSTSHTVSTDSLMPDVKSTADETNTSYATTTESISSSVPVQSAAYLNENTYGTFTYVILTDLGLSRNNTMAQKIAAAIKKTLNEKGISQDGIRDVKAFADENAGANFSYNGNQYALILSHDASTDEYAAYIQKDKDAQNMSPQDIAQSTMENASINLPEEVGDALSPFGMDETEFMKRLAEECRAYGITYQTVKWGAVTSSESDSRYSVLLYLDGDTNRAVEVSLNKLTRNVLYIFK